MRIIAKPFLKWAGGKSQLINEIGTVLPNDFDKKYTTYVEPFVGSGALLFWILNNYPHIRKVVINDINEDLINTYKVMVSDVNRLISILSIFQDEYHSLENKQDEKKAYYNHKRSLYNGRQSDKCTHAALFIFLNRTCFNGLYRVNRKNEFNVPIGSYKKPKICDSDNLLAVSKVLEKVEILCGDFERTIGYADQSLFYLDPPYKPLSQTSNFNSYARDVFDDSAQRRLRAFCEKLDEKKCPWILSNSDVKGVNPKDDFFDELYKEYFIKRVYAKRSINSNPEKRGILTELLITNQNEYGD